LRVAIKANPLKSDQIEAARDTAAEILTAPAAPLTRTNRKRRPHRRNNRNLQTGLILLAAALGWAATRRRQQARKTEI